ncbi:MAG: cystathionine beta-synthase [Nonlabens sp.]
MQKSTVFSFINDVLNNIPDDWRRLTTHRLDIYNEEQAKTDFLKGFEQLFLRNDATTESLSALPTAYDYIRLGHPLSCVLEWMMAKLNDRSTESVIAFGSETMSILSVLRKNSLDGVATRLVFENKMPQKLNQEILSEVYEYDFEVLELESRVADLEPLNGTTVFVSDRPLFESIDLSNVDCTVHLCGVLGSVITITNEDYHNYIADIQHVRRRETVAMTPEDTYQLLQSLVNNQSMEEAKSSTNSKSKVQGYIRDIAGIETMPFVGSSGLSIQYAIMMGLVDYAKQNHAGKAIKFIVPTNCYGGTNDQARRVADCIENVEIVDLHVDGDSDMVTGLRKILDDLAHKDAVPYIIAEIPTNPRVEVPDLEELKEVLSQDRTTDSGSAAVDPVFILDQTFCPNLQFMKEGELLSEVRGITYASGSKFPSGGKCTAGYCYTNDRGKGLADKIGQHLDLCDNEATALQYDLLAEQLPSMNERIASAYKNTREFVSFIEETLPEAKINFVSEKLAERGFTPSVFSMDLPTQGDTPEDREAYKRAQNLKLIHKMIGQIPNESKFCVSYGQLKGCYWTVPATSTQGTTKEEDKDYIVRASLSPNLDLEKHKEVFKEFVRGME